MKPKLRFKEFSGNWENKTLGELVFFLDGKRKPLEKGERIGGKYPYYGASGIIDYVKDYIFDEELILLSEDGANIIDRNYRVCFLASGKYWVNNHAHVLKAKENNYNAFVCEALERLNYQKYNTGTAQPKLNQEVCKRITLSAPSLSEQIKIADFLSTVDEKIQNQQDKIIHLENIKKGFMQKIFSRKIRFKDDAGNEFPEWEEKKLGHRVEEYNFKTIKQNQYPILSSTKSGIYLQSEYFNKQAASENTLGYKIVPKGYFTYRSMSDTGEFTFNIQNIINNGIVSPAYPVFKADKDNSIFLQLLLNNSNFIKKQLLVLKEGGTRYALSFEKFCKLKVFIPCLEEQEKIANFLSSFDEKIDVEKDTLEHLKELKKGLLQQMFV